MEKEVEAIKEELYRCSWFMRGGVPYEQLLEIDRKDLEIIQRVISKNLDTTKESGLPFF